MLILSKDDETFNERIKQELIDLMPNPKVCDYLSGGHLALLLKIDSYISLVKDFLKNENANITGGLPKELGTEVDFI